VTRLNRTRIIGALLASIGVAIWQPWQRFDPAPWLADLQLLEDSTAAHYANLDWKVTQGAVDPVALHRRTDSLIRNAGSAGEARRALVEFGRAFNDGHFSVRRPVPAIAARLERLFRGGGTSSVVASDLDGATACARLGYGNRSSSSILSSADGWRAMDGGAFPAGLVPLPDGRTAGVLRIPHFGQDGYPGACAATWDAFRDSITGNDDCDDDCRWRFERNVANSLLADEARAVRRLQAAGAEMLIVDLTGNGGGTNWVDPAARQLAARPLPGPSGSGVRHPHHVRQLEGIREPLVRDLTRADLRAGQRELLTAALSRLDSALAEARAPCDRSGIWHHPLPPGCDVLYAPRLAATGLLDWAPDSLLIGLESAPELFWPILYRYKVGVWDGPVAVLVDHGTASASEGFASQLRDAGAAVIVGEHTYGAGCGYTNGGLPLRLPESGLEVVMPDCARFRANGVNEVEGITPDVPAGWRQGDDEATRARFALEAISKATPR
jgi:peptidase S41-like protein